MIFLFFVINWFSPVPLLNPFGTRIPTGNTGWAVGRSYRRKRKSLQQPYECVVQLTHLFKLRVMLGCVATGRHLAREAQVHGAQLRRGYVLPAVVRRVLLRVRRHCGHGHHGLRGELAEADADAGTVAVCIDNSLSLTSNPFSLPLLPPIYRSVSFESPPLPSTPTKPPPPPLLVSAR